MKIVGMQDSQVACVHWRQDQDKKQLNFSSLGQV